MAILAAAAPSQTDSTPRDLEDLARELGDPSLRAHASVVLTRAGRDGAAAVGALIGSDAELDDETLDAACRILESLGIDGAPGAQGVVERFYETAQGSHRERLIRCLGQIGAFDHAARDDWHKRLREGADSPLSAQGFFLTVGAMKANGSEGSASELIGSLEDANAYVRCGAALAIGHRASTWSAEDRKKLIDALVADITAEGRGDSFRMEWLWGAGNASTSGSVSERDLAAIRLRSRWALARLSPGHPTAAGGHVLDFGHTDPIVARKAIQMVMASATPGDPDIINGLVGALHSDREDVAREAAVALGVLGTGSDHARRELEAVVADDERPRLVECAEAALASLGR